MYLFTVSQLKPGFKSAITSTPITKLRNLPNLADISHIAASSPLTTRVSPTAVKTSTLVYSPVHLNLPSSDSGAHHSLIPIIPEEDIEVDDSSVRPKWLVQRRGNIATSPPEGVGPPIDFIPSQSVRFNPSHFSSMNCGTETDSHVSQLFISPKNVEAPLQSKTRTRAKGSETEASIHDTRHYYQRSILSVHSAALAAGRLCRSVVSSRASLRPTRVRLTKSDTTRLTLKAALNTTYVTIDGKQVELVGRNKVLSFCEPKYMTTFSDALKDLMNGCIKIGEGSYAEVFGSKNSNGEPVVFKIIPYTADLDENTWFSSMLPELSISSCFNELRSGKVNNCDNFINFLRASCVKDGFPKQLMDQWIVYDKAIGSENEHPIVYGDSNVYLILVYGNGGSDLEKYSFRSAEESLSVFLQIVFALAAAENEFEFEHRDLHWGNILVDDTQSVELNYKVKRRNYRIPSQGKKVSIIDFTLSRVSKDGFTIYDDLEKYKELFSGVGDYQFEIYRKMRLENRGDWSKFCPKTNILWCEYLLHKLIDDKKYRARSKPHYAALGSLKEIRSVILGFRSAHDLIAKCPLFTKYLHCK